MQHFLIITATKKFENFTLNITAYQLIFIIHFCIVFINFKIREFTRLHDYKTLCKVENEKSKRYKFSRSALDLQLSKLKYEKEFSKFQYRPVYYYWLSHISTTTSLISTDGRADSLPDRWYKRL